MPDAILVQYGTGILVIIQHNINRNDMLVKVEIYMLLETRNINLSFNGSRVLFDVNFFVKRNEVHGLIGPNGSGKSTFIKILSGALKQDSGDIYIDGKIHENSAIKSIRQGIFTLYQDMFLLPNLSVVDNLYMGNYETKFKIFVSKKIMKKKCIEILREFECNISPYKLAKNLTPSERYIVTVAKAFLKEARILILDEPTASLSLNERKVVLKLIQRIKNKGTSVIFISHNLNEIREVCDSLSIMRDGKIVCTENMSDISDEYIYKMMSVSDICINKRTYQMENEVLRVENLYKNGVLKNINFSLYKGEIVGILGVNGSGRSTLLKILFGATTPDHGNCYFNGEKIKRYSINNSINKGIGYLPDDRLIAGILPNLSVLENVILAKRKQKYSWLISNKKESEIFIKYIVDQGFYLADPNQPILNQSSGNQQKSIFFRWLISSSKILLLDEPTKGIDIASKNEMYNIILDRASSGVSFLICSCDILELQPVCSRILLLEDGKLSEHTFDI
jgi:ABC-type sugar transport system ATPase subunit